MWRKVVNFVKSPEAIVTLIFLTLVAITLAVPFL